MNSDLADPPILLKFITSIKADPGGSLSTNRYSRAPSISWWTPATE
jgi:hypothetical protein